MDGEARVEVAPVEDGSERWAEAVTTLLGRHPLLAEGDVRLLRVRSDGTRDKEGRGDEPGDVLAEAYDYAPHKGRQATRVSLARALGEDQ